jgi:ABC-type uncharacterized transport system fused permease/ATPase subunit
MPLPNIKQAESVAIWNVFFPSIGVFVNIAGNFPSVNTLQIELKCNLFLNRRRNCNKIFHNNDFSKQYFHRCIYSVIQFDRQYGRTKFPNLRGHLIVPVLFATCNFKNIFLEMYVHVYRLTPTFILSLPRLLVTETP